MSVPKIEFTVYGDVVRVLRIRDGRADVRSVDGRQYWVPVSHLRESEPEEIEGAARFAAFESMGESMSGFQGPPTERDRGAEYEPEIPAPVDDGPEDNWGAW